MLSLFDNLSLHNLSQSFHFSRQFHVLALGVLEQCYRENDDKTWQLLTYELKNWSDWTCLSLAVISHHQEFVAHKCCQMILNDLWMGGMSIRKYLNYKVIASILFFPLVLRIEFKSVEELKLQPKTHEEHLATQDPDDDEDEDDDDKYYDSDEYPSGTLSNDYTHCRVSEDNLKRKFSKKTLNDTSVEFILENQNTENESIEMSDLSKTNQLKQTLSVPIHHTDDLNDINIESPKKLEDLIKKPSSISLTQRFYEFYNAPITKFWYNAIFYVIFLFLFTYMVLVRTPLRPSIAGKRFWNNRFVLFENLHV